MTRYFFRKIRKSFIALFSVCVIVTGSGSLVKAEETERELLVIQRAGFKEHVKKRPVDPHPEHEKRNKLLDAKKRSIDKDILALTETEGLADAPELLEKEDHIPVVLHYSDGTKEIYCFFKAGDEIYMKNKEGIVWADADFIEEYVLFPEYPDVENDPNKLSGATIHLPDKLALSMAKEMECIDERYYFVLDVSQRMSYGESQEKAIEGARAKMLSDMRMYEYALRHEFEIPEEELKAEAEKRKEIFRGAGNYGEMALEYEAAGLSISEYHDKVYNVSNDNFRMRNTLDWMHKAKYEEFKHGEDMVGDVICEDFGEYWMHFINDMVLPEAETYDLSEYEKILDEAEAYYLEITSE